MTTTEAKPFVTEISLSNITEGETNPRKSFDKEALAELSASVATHGILQPVLVRPKRGGFELVAGHRRVRAAKSAALKTIPALIRDLDDKQVLEVQVIENLQREDLHELEEAEGYRQLIKNYGYTVEELATKVGKSRAYVYARMKLADLPPVAKDLFHAGELNASTALLVARIPVKEIAEKAAKEIAKDHQFDGKMSFRDAQRYVQEECMLQLKAAPFDKKAEDLVKDAGPCVKCPKRTGNQPDLFGDVSADVCTDPKCFRAKATATFKRELAKGLEAGDREPTKKELQALTRGGRYYGSASYSSGLVDLDEECYASPKRAKWRALLGKDCPRRVLLQNPETHGLVELVSEKEANAVLRGKFKWAQAKNGSSGRSASATAAEKKRQLDGKVRNAALRGAMADLVVWAENTLGKKAKDSIWRPLALAAIGSAWSDTAKDTEKRRELAKPAKSRGHREPLEAFVRTATGTECVGVLVELLARRASTEYSSTKDAWKDLCKTAGVDLAMHKRKARKELTPKAAPKKKAKKKLRKKAGGKKR
jgi:ParB/RepB/Spo0J family partition protein